MTTEARVALRAAVERAVLAPSEHNAQPWRWRLHGDVLDLRADRSRRLLAADEHGRGMLLGCGAALGLLQVALAAAGWTAHVRHGTDVDEARPLAQVTVTRSPGPPAERVRRWAAAIDTRRTDRRRFASREVPPDDVDRLIEAARPFGGTLHQVVGSARRAVVEAARQADAEQRAREDYAGELQRWTHRLAGARDGIPAGSRPNFPAPEHGDVPMRWMPPGSLPSPRAGLDQHDASLLLLLAAQADDTVSLVRAGESLGVVLLEAESLGLRVTPFTQALELAGTRDRVRRLALGAHRFPVIALRVGRPLPTAGPIPPTPRRPLSAVLAEEP